MIFIQPTLSNIITYNIWMFPKIGGKPPKWMVYFMENPIKMDDLGGKPPIFWKHPYKQPENFTVHHPFTSSIWGTPPFASVTRPCGASNLGRKFGGRHRFFTAMNSGTNFFEGTNGVYFPINFCFFVFLGDKQKGAMSFSKAVIIVRRLPVR